MNIQNMRKEIQELRNSLLYRYEPACRAFILGKEDSPTETEIAAYRQEHPHIRVIVLYRRNCRKGSAG